MQPCSAGPSGYSRGQKPALSSVFSLQILDSARCVRACGVGQALSQWWAASAGTTCTQEACAVTHDALLCSRCDRGCTRAPPAAHTTNSTPPQHAMGCVECSSQCARRSRVHSLCMALLPAMALPVPTAAEPRQRTRAAALPPRCCVHAMWRPPRPRACRRSALRLPPRPTPSGAGPQTWWCPW
jgi:hypothetical protein